MAAANLGKLEKAELKSTGADEPAIIANNNMARLMYYLKCVGGVLPGIIDDRLRDHKNYHRLCHLDQLKVFQLCETYSPDELDGKVLFNEPRLCKPGFNGWFYEITAAQRRHLFVSENVFIAGRRHTVTDIMVYEESWVKRNYHDPMCAERDRLHAVRRTRLTVWWCKPAKHSHTSMPLHVPWMLST